MSGMESGSIGSGLSERSKRALAETSNLPTFSLDVVDRAVREGVLVHDVGEEGAGSFTLAPTCVSPRAKSTPHPPPTSAPAPSMPVEADCYRP